MLESLRVKVVDWIQTRLNPHVGRRHPIHILMTNVGLKPIPRKNRHIYHVALDGGRLIGIYETIIPGDIFKTCLRVCIYEKRTTEEKTFGQSSYCAASIFFHSGDDDRFKLGSMYRTNFISFEELAKHLRMTKSHAVPRAEVFRLQQSSKQKRDSIIKA